jgi:predicted hotdog family 3-hydroxylacyl-ACP dehydratase
MHSVTTACIEKAEIRELIPHSDSMCLLDSVLAWDDESIVCASQTHLDGTNPLRRQEHLSAIHAFEYGAQAVAIHGGLRARSAGAFSPPGYLAALRHASVTVRSLNQFNCPLEVRARRLFSDSANCVYQCRVSAGEDVVAEGRVTIILRDRRSLHEPELDSRNGLPAPANPVSQTSPIVFEIHCRVPADHPSLPGHFPDEPIVPGVVILDEVAGALSQWRQSRITHIHLAKFLSPLKPEKIFTISFANPSRAAQVGFRCQVENRPIVEGCLEVASYD